MRCFATLPIKITEDNSHKIMVHGRVGMRNAKYDTELHFTVSVHPPR